MRLEDKIDQGNRNWIKAFKEMDYILFASLFTEDGAILKENNQIIQGRDAIMTYMQRSMLDSGPCTFTIKTLNIYTIMPDIYEKGSYTMTFENGATHSGHYIVIWRFDQNNQLKIYRDIGV